jgi:outer membrane protein TolC
MRRILWLAAVALTARAETYTLTLKQAVDRAAAENPEVAMARLDEIKAGAAVRIAKDPFSTHVGAGSGAGYTYGNPVDGSAPAIFQVRANQSLFNKPQSLSVAQAKENAKGAGLATGEKRDDVAYRVAGMYVDLDRAVRLEDTLAKQVASLEKIAAAVGARVDGGRELPISKKEADLNVLKAKQRLENARDDRDYAARSLAVALGYAASDSVQPAAVDRAPLSTPVSEEAALQTAYAANKELQRLQSSLIAKGLEIDGDKAQKLPRVDLQAQYALLSPYENYAQYFVKFQRNELAIGASVQIPIWVGPAVKAQISQAEADRQKIRTQEESVRNRIALDVHRGFQELAKASMTSQVAKAELDLAHDRLSVLLAQMNEGRVLLKQVEDARLAEDEKWVAFYDAQFSDEKARLALLKETGQLIASLR